MAAPSPRTNSKAVSLNAPELGAPRWYFVCRRCNAKWFAKEANAGCPRCYLSARSTTQLVPPWHRNVVPKER